MTEIEVGINYKFFKMCAGRKFSDMSWTELKYYRDMLTNGQKMAVVGTDGRLIYVEE